MRNDLAKEGIKQRIFVDLVTPPRYFMDLEFGPYSKLYTLDIPTFTIEEEETTEIFSHPLPYEYEDKISRFDEYKQVLPV